MLKLDRFENYFYHASMQMPRTRTSTSRLRGRMRERIRWQPLARGGDAWATGEIVHAAAGKAGPLALEAGEPPRSGEKWLKEPRRQAPGLVIKAEFDQKVTQLRRGESPEQASYEILSPMGSPSPVNNANSDASAASPDGVSAFIARVLDQLTLSAWLPAAFLTASVAVLLQFRSTKSANVLSAVRELTKDPVQVLVIMIPLLVIATIVTQAFSFEAIRTLEGYWRGRGPASLVHTLMIRWHVHRKNAIIRRRQKESAKTLRAAMPDMILRGGVSVPIIRAIEAELSGRDEEIPGLADEDDEAFARTITMWRTWGAPWRLAKIDRLITEENLYPGDSRIMPTKLGNLMRATEDHLRHADGDVQGFVLRRRGTVSRRVQKQHDQFRTRLEMYCTLVFVSGFLSILTPVVLIGRTGIAAITVIAASFAAMGVASYLAAIASAGGYCVALKQMDDAA